MTDKLKFTLWRLLPVILISLAAAFSINEAQGGGPYVMRNLIPLAILVLLSAAVLFRGGGRWSGSGMRLPLGVAGYAIPAFGLTLYLHYAYAVNLDDMFTGTADPEQVFRYLPIYTIVAGGVGFAIGWIAGRNV